MFEAQKPTAAEWCEFDPKVRITGQKHGKRVEGHLTYYGQAPQGEVNKMIPGTGVIDEHGDLFISVSPPDFPWRVEGTFTWEGKYYAEAIYGTPDCPLEPGKPLNFTIRLP